MICFILYYLYKIGSRGVYMLGPWACCMLHLLISFLHNSPRLVRFSLLHWASWVEANLEARCWSNWCGSVAQPVELGSMAQFRICATTFISDDYISGEHVY